MVFYTPPASPLRSDTYRFAESSRHVARQVSQLLNALLRHGLEKGVTTSVRRLISRLNRLVGLFDQTLFRTDFGTLVNANKSSKDSTRLVRIVRKPLPANCHELTRLSPYRLYIWLLEYRVKNCRKVWPLCLDQ